MARRIKVSHAVVVGLALVLSFGADQSPAVAAGDEDVLANAIRFRTGVGFKADVPFVDATLRDPAYSSHQYGVPLSETEAAEVARRMGVQRALIPAETLASRLPGYAGSYMDQSQGGMPVFAFVGNPEARGAQLAGLIPPGISFGVIGVDRSYADLETLRDSIFENRDSLASVGIEVVSVGLQPSTNSVVVMASSPADEAQAVLDAWYGAGVRAQTHGATELDACSRGNCLPMKGGLKLWTSSYQCTSGFMGKLGTETRIITAGHCIYGNGGTYTTWYHPSGTTIGLARGHTFYEGTIADAGTINVNSISGAKNLLVANSYTTFVSVLGYYASESQNQGDLVCRSGGTTYYLCGLIEIVDATKINDDFGPVTVHHQWVTDIDAQPGDSGAPFIDKVSTYFGYGIHSDSSTGYSLAYGKGWYSPIPWVLEAYPDLEFCGNYDCTS